MQHSLSGTVVAISPTTACAPRVGRIVSDPRPNSQCFSHAFFLGDVSADVPETGFGAYLFASPPRYSPPYNSFLLDSNLISLKDGDVVHLDPVSNKIRVLYRRASNHNFLLLTERCNNRCIMCSQPPRADDNSQLVQVALQAIPLFAKDTVGITLTGGEPSLLGPHFLSILHELKVHLPKTSVHVLSNGRGFKDIKLAKAVAAIRHPDLMIGIPLHSDISWTHDYLAQADGAYDDTIRGIINLKGNDVRVELRVIIHRVNYQRLPALAEFISRNLTFCDHVAFMGIEMTGNAMTNRELLWIDPIQYVPQLEASVRLLNIAHIPVSIFNHQLCILPSSLHRFSRKSISDWKCEYIPECRRCSCQSDCGGFFATGNSFRSAAINPMLPSNFPQEKFPGC